MNNDMLKVFTSDYNLKIHGRELSRILEIPQKTIQNKLNELEKDKILKSEIVGKNKEFSLDLQNDLTLKYIEIAEIEKMIDLTRKISLIREILQKISQYEGIFLIFGSYAKRNQNKDSDIDILYIGEQNIKKLSAELRYFPKKIHLISISPESFLKDLKKPFIKEILANHVILYGTERFIRIQKDTMVQ